MTLNRRLFCQTAALGALGSMAPGAFANTDKFPGKPIRIIVPYNAGGLVDTVARHAATAASPILGQPVLIDNRPGVGGNLGAELVAKSPADGYTLLCMLSGSLSTGAAVFTKLKYDPGKDLRCFSELIMTNAIWTVNSALPVKNVKELVAYSKANPGKVSIGSWGPGTTGNVAQVLLNKRYGADILHVPYKGEAQIMTDVIGGQVSMGLMSAMIVSAQMKSGKLRPIGVSGANRSSVFPDLPTLAEQGFKEEAWSMNGPVAMFSPQGMDPKVLATLGAAFAQSAKGPKMQAFAKEVGVEVAGNTPEQAQAHFERYFAVNKRVTQETGVVLD